MTKDTRSSSSRAMPVVPTCWGACREGLPRGLQAGSVSAAHPTQRQQVTEVLELPSSLLEGDGAAQQVSRTFRWKLKE